MPIQEIISLLIAKIKYFIIFTIIGGVLGFSIAYFLIPEKYTSSVNLYVKSSTSASTTGDVNQNQLETAKSLADTYIVILQDKDVLDRIAAKFSEDYDINELAKYLPITQNEDGEPVVSSSYIKNCLSIGTVNSTEVLKVTAVTEVPQFSTDICNYMAEIAPDVLKRVTKSGAVEAFNMPTVPKKPSSPNIPKITLFCAFIALALSVAVVLMRDIFNNKVSTGADVKERFDVPVLAEIPTFDSKSKKGVYK